MSGYKEQAGLMSVSRRSTGMSSNQALQSGTPVERGRELEVGRSRGLMTGKRIECGHHGGPASRSSAGFSRCSAISPAASPLISA